MLYNAAKRPRICTHGVPSPVALIHNTLNCISQRLSRLIQPNQKYTTTSKVNALRLRRRAQSISITIDWKTQVLLVVRQSALQSMSSETSPSMEGSMSRITRPWTAQTYNDYHWTQRQFLLHLPQCPPREDLQHANTGFPILKALQLQGPTNIETKVLSQHTKMYLNHFLFTRIIYRL